MTDTHHALPAGHALMGGDYIIVRELGAGGFGITYLATDTVLDKSVAIKEYLPNEFALRSGGATVQPKSTASRGDYEWGLARFADEARVLARFDYPTINQVHRLFNENGTAYMVLEYIEGETLSAVLKREKILPAARLLSLMTELLAGLTHVHAADFVHRDIKPSNIIFRPDGRAVLLDFGAARQAIGSKTKTLTAVLTPGYAPVEQYDSKATDVGAWSDLYALGMVAYRCVSGLPDSELPDAINRQRQMDRDRGDFAPAVEVGAGHYPPELLAAIDWAIIIDERKRPQSVAAMEGAIGSLATVAATASPALTATVAETAETEETTELIPETLDLHLIIGFSVFLAIAMITTAAYEAYALTSVIAVVGVATLGFLWVHDLLNSDGRTNVMYIPPFLKHLLKTVKGDGHGRTWAKNAVWMTVSGLVGAGAIVNASASGSYIEVGVIAAAIVGTLGLLWDFGSSNDKNQTELHRATPPRGPLAAVRVCLAKYCDFSGRASRSEYWWFFLFCLLLPFVVAVTVTIAFLLNNRTLFDSVVLLFSDVTLLLFSVVTPLLFSIVTLPPFFAVGARRLHDIGRSGWWMLLMPLSAVLLNSHDLNHLLFIGWLPLIIMLCSRSK